TSILAGGFGTAAPWVAGGFLLAGAAGASGIDAVGGIAYLRAVKFHQRQRMTAVYRTYLELSDVVPSLIYMVVLRYTGVSIVFVLIGAFAGFVGLLSWRHLPKTM
ncbi:MAG: MFS transporter, partial [Aestuariivirga sp.]